MKLANYSVLLFLLLAVNLSTAQEEVKESKFSIIGWGGIGYGNVDSENEANYNLNTNTGEILLNYKFGKHIGVATGIGLNELSGNGFNTLGNFYHERELIKIPVLATMEYPIIEKVRFVGAFGLYAQTIINDEYQFVDNTIKDLYGGWNFGFQVGLAFLFDLSEYFSIGLNFNGQGDFTNFKTENNQPITDEQRLTSFNSIGVAFQFRL